MRGRGAGFTLVEVMVALAIVAVALPALLTSLYQQADDTAYLRDKALAQMVAANKLEEVRLAAAATSAVRPGRESGMSSMARRDWYWWVEIAAAPGVPNFYRVEIVVGPDADDPQNRLYALSGFLSGDRTEDLDALQEDDDGGSQEQGTETPQQQGSQSQSARDAAERLVPGVVNPDDR